MAEQALTPLIAQRHPPVAAPTHVRDAVVSREPFVEKRVVRAQQVDDAPVLPQLAFHEQLGLTLKGLAEVLVEPGKQIRIRCDAADAAQHQPLASEIVDQRRRPGISQHPVHLLVERGRVAQLASSREIEELVVGNAAPHEERQPRRQLEIAQTIDGARCCTDRIALDTKQKLGVDQDAFERRLDARFEATIGAAGLVERKQRLEVVVGDRAAERAARQRRENRPGAPRLVLVCRAVGLADEEPVAAGRLTWPRHRVRAIDGDALQPRSL